MSRAWELAMVTVPAMAAAVPAGTAAGWVAATCVAAVTFLVGAMARAVERQVAAADATDSFLAQCEASGLSSADQALARRVGLDPETLVEAKAAVKAAVREVMFRRGAGVGSLARVHAVSASSAAPAAPESSRVVLGEPLPAAAVAAARGAAGVSGKDSSNRERQEVTSGLEASDILAGTAAAVARGRSGGDAAAAGRAAEAAEKLKGRDRDDLA